MTQIFTPAELAYLSEQTLARLATIGPDGGPQVRPVSFFVLADGTVDVGGHAIATTQKFRNVLARPQVALVVDDLASRNPWTPRAVEIRGLAEALPDAPPPVQWFGKGVIRIRPQRIIVLGLDEDGPGSRTVAA